MAVSGINFKSRNAVASKPLQGVYGIRFKLNLIGVKIIDFRGRGLVNVNVRAENPTTGNPYEIQTDSTGSAFMQLDNGTEIKITKNRITKTVQYAGEASPTYIIDLPFIQ